MALSEKEMLEQMMQVELSRKDFWWYCKTMAPEFCSEDKTYLKEMAHTLQKFYEDDDSEALFISCPPRHGKTLLIGLFISFCLGLSPLDSRCMSASYNTILSTETSKAIRDRISREKIEPNQIVYSDIFPTRLKRGDGKMNMWSVDNSPTKSFISSSPNSTSTGYGCNILVIDDIVSRYSEGISEVYLQKCWDFFRNTLYSRLEGGRGKKRKLVVCMTRWHRLDLIGRLKTLFVENNLKFDEILLKAENSDGTMLCDAVLSKKEFEMQKRISSEDLIMANYQQQPIDMVGRLYDHFDYYVDDNYQGEDKDIYYKKPDLNNCKIFSIVDSADLGADFCVALSYCIYNMKAYLLDVIMTQAPMSVTEPLLATTFRDLQVTEAFFESNNSGVSFARNVEREMKSIGYHACNVTWAPTTMNKMTKILSCSTGVMNNIIFPKDWDERFPEFYNSVINFQRCGVPIHDDAEDALSMLYLRLSEMFGYTV